MWKKILVSVAVACALLVPTFANADAIDEGRMYITESSGTITLGCKAPCHVKLPSTTAGYDVVLDISANTYTFTDGGFATASNLDGLGFGITETVDWAVDAHFFYYLVNETNAKGDVGWFISRSPTLAVTPAATYIHDKDAAAANDTQSSIFGAWSDDAGKAAKPVRLIGASRMQFSTAAGPPNDAWSTQTFGNTDGIGQDRLAKTFAIRWTSPVGQNSNESGKLYAVADGGTTLAFTTYTGYYYLSDDGFCRYIWDFDNQTANGGDGTALKLYGPLRPVSGDLQDMGGQALIVAGGVTYTYLCDINPSTQVISMRYQSTAAIVNDDIFAGGTDSVNGVIVYRAF